MRLSDAEWTVMNAVWQHTPASARDVLESVGDETGWAYSTVKTILARLADKGALSVRMRANTSLYDPQISREQARRSALRSLVDSAFDGAFGSLIQHLAKAERLTKKDRTRLAGMLEDLDRGKETRDKETRDKETRDKETGG